MYSIDDGASWNEFAISTSYTIGASKSFKIAAGSESTPGKTTNLGFSKAMKDCYGFGFINSSGAKLTDPVVSVSGDITSLLNGVGGDVDLSSTEGGANYNYCFYSLFAAASCITTAPNLPSTKLASSCYKNMFSGCASLISVPNLAATELSNYCCQYMFENCTSLVSAPNLPATRIMTSSYTCMFSGCTSLVKIPDLSHITSISNNLNKMFAECTNLSITTTTGAGNWSIGNSTTIGRIGSYMFDNCTGVDFGGGSTTPTIGTKYYLGIPGVSFEPLTSLSGYYMKGSTKQAMCAFGVTAISDNLSSITEFGFAVYNGSSYEDTIKTTDASKIKELTEDKGGRFYTIIDCNGAGVTKTIKAYAKIKTKRYESSVISATSNLDDEYAI